MQLLIVDDSKIERMILKEMLQSEGYAVQEAENGQQALQMALLSCPDMIISDILMPVMDGFKFCREIRADKRTCEIPFVFYTGTYTKAEDEDFAFKMGADRFLVKNMEWSDFFRGLQDVIREKEMGSTALSEDPSHDEKEIYKLYNERLIKKLEDKVAELEHEVSWRKKLEKQLYDSQESLEMAMDGAQLGMWDWNVQTGEVKFNEQWADSFGYAPEDLPPHINTWEKLIHPDDLPNTMAILQANLNGVTELYETEHRLKDKAGNWHWFLAKGKVASRNEAGEPLRHVGTFLDITDRVKAKKALEASHDQMEKQVEIRTADILKSNQQLKDEILLRNKIEAALRESEERFRMLAENARDVIYRMTLPDGIYEYISPAAVSIFGYSINDFYQNPLLIRQILHPDWVDYFDEHWKAFLNGIVQPVYELQIIHKSGEARWLHFRNVLIRDANENPIAIEGIGTDITGLKQAEIALAKQNEDLDELVAVRTSKLQVVREALEIEKERYRLIIDTVPIGIVHYDLKGVITECNERFVEINGASRENFIGANMLESLKNKPLLSAVKKSLAGEESYFEGEATCVFSGRTFYSKRDFVPVFSDDDRVDGGVCVVEDISEKMKAKKALQKSEKKYRTILESIEDGYFEVDRAGNLTFFNNALCDILGYPASELKGKNYRAYMDDDYAQKTYQKFNQVFKSGKSGKEFDWKIIRKDGVDRYLDALVSPIKDSMGHIAGFRGVVRDVSERRLMQQFLAESEERFRMIFESAPVGIFNYDKNGIIQTCNQAYVDINGSSFGKLIGFNLLKSVTNKLVLEALQKSLAGMRGHYVGEYTSVTGGRKSYIKADFVPVFSENQSLSGGMCVVEDITEQERTKEALKGSEEKFKKLADNSPGIIMLSDMNGVCRFVSPSIERIIGYRPEEVLGTVPADFYSPDQAGRIMNAVSRAREGKPLKRFEVELQKKDGTDAVLELECIPVREEDQIVGIQYLGKDITEQKKTENALKHSRQQLRELSKHLQNSREQERAGIAREIHDDLGQSLTAIKMDISWLKNKLPEERAELHSKAEDSIVLVDSAIQTVKRISSGLRPGLLDDLGLSAAIEWQAKEFQKRSDINIDVIVEPEDIVLDEDLSIALFRVCQETLTNVVRHSGATGVWVTLRENSQLVSLEVADNGCGISDQAMSKKNSFGLIGMLERIHAMGGKISISRIQEGGTKVSVKVPLGAPVN